MLQDVYGPTKVLSPYVLNIDAIKDYDAEGKLAIPTSLLLCHEHLLTVLCPLLIKYDCMVTV